MDILKIRTLNEADTGGDTVIRGGRWFRAEILPFEFLADSAQRIRSHGTIVQTRIAMAAE